MGYYWDIERDRRMEEGRRRKEVYVNFASFTFPQKEKKSKSCFSETLGEISETRITCDAPEKVRMKYITVFG